LDHSKFFQVAKGKIIEMDSFLSESEAILRDRLIDLDRKFDQELRKLNKELQVIMVRHQNIVLAH
jgi:hypothetical protein